MYEKNKQFINNKLNCHIAKFPCSFLKLNLNDCIKNRLIIACQMSKNKHTDRNELCLCNNASSSQHLFSLARTNLFNTLQHHKNRDNKLIFSYQLLGLYNGVLDDCVPDCKSTAGVPQASFTPGTRHPQPCLVQEETNGK